MTVLITGGAGFIGSHLAEALLDAGRRVVVVDDLSTGAQANIAHLVGREDFQFVRESVRNREVMTVLMDRCDVVYHLAGIAGLDDASTRPVETVRQNVMGTVHLLDECVAASVKRFVYASTIYVYSEKGGFYRCSKQAAETYIHEYHRRHALNYTILRFGTLYGPRADKRNSVWRYLYQALRENRIIGGGTGEELREYIHVRDAARLSVQVLGEEYSNQQVTITGHHPIKYRQLLEMIKEMLGGRVEIIFDNVENEDHYSLTPYSYTPKIGHKLISNFYVDMGQGLLECIQEVEGLISSDAHEKIVAIDDTDR